MKVKVSLVEEEANVIDNKPLMEVCRSFPKTFEKICLNLFF
jgi:hypothetical protein